MRQEDSVFSWTWFLFSFIQPSSIIFKFFDQLANIEFKSRFFDRKSVLIEFSSLKNPPWLSTEPIEIFRFWSEEAIARGSRIIKIIFDFGNHDGLTWSNVKINQKIWKIIRKIQTFPSQCIHIPQRKRVLVAQLFCSSIMFSYFLSFPNHQKILKVWWPLPIILSRNSEQISS